MGFLKSVNKRYKLLKDLDVIKSLCFLLIPFLLWFQLGEQLPSISQYAQEIPLSFAVYLTAVSLLFFDNGFEDRSKWFEMTIGASMIGVVLFDNEGYYYTHYAFAGYFFLGSIFNMIFFSSGKYRKYTITIGVTILLAMAGKFVFDFYTIFWAEFLGMIPISLHKILERMGKID